MQCTGCSQDIRPKACISELISSLSLLQNLLAPPPFFIHFLYSLLLLDACPLLLFFEPYQLFFLLYPLERLPLTFVAVALLLFFSFPVLLVALYFCVLLPLFSVQQLLSLHYF